MSTKINKSSSSTAEAIMICIDTSGWMENKESSRFKDQAQAIRLYCTHKFKSNPHTVVGISGMGERCTIINLIKPTRNIDLIMESIYDANISGDFLIVAGVMDYHEFLYRGEDIGICLPKRMAVFAGGHLYYEKKVMKDLGKRMKEHNVACDAIIFGDVARNRKELFETLIAAVDVKGNCNLVHVPPKSTVLAALFSSPILQGGASASHESYFVAALSLSRSLNVGASCRQQESSSVAALDLSRSLSVQQESYLDSVNPVEIAAWSQWSLDLKLDNANPNWETFDQKTGWETCDPPINRETFDQETTGWEIFDPKTGTWKPELVANTNWETFDQKTGTCSQSTLDLKLDSANPNWQADETLDQKIERLQRELQSLIQQRNQQVAC